MRLRHAAAAVLLRAAATRAEEIAQVLLDVAKMVRIVAVGQEASLDQRIVHMRFDDVVHQCRNACGAAETLVQIVAHAVPLLLLTLRKKGRANQAAIEFWFETMDILLLELRGD